MGAGRPRLEITDEERKQRNIEMKKKWFKKKMEDPEFRVQQVKKTQQWREQRQAQHIKA